MSVVIFSFTSNGTKISRQLNTIFKDNGEVVTSYAPTKYATDGVNEIGDLGFVTGQYFNKGNKLIFIGATGIAVRSIAPFIKGKDVDPAVVVIDEQGQYVIPILSGHIGGANGLAKLIANAIGANAVITTATDINGKFSVDSFASKNGLAISDMKIAKDVSAALIDEKKVAVSGNVPRGEMPSGLVNDNENSEANIVICISSSNDDELCNRYEEVLYLTPKDLVVGIGCKKETDCDSIEAFVNDVLLENHLRKEGIAVIASIDIKKDEEGIAELARKLGVPFVTYSATELKNVSGEFTGSSFVESITGVNNVCERASAAYGNSEVIVKKVAKDGITVAVSRLTEKELWFD